MSAPLPLDPEERREQRAAEREARELADMPFAPVDALPKMRTGSNLPKIPVPEMRQKLIAYCIEHPGQWVEYRPTPEQDKAKVASFSAMVRKLHGGFVPGFQVKVRNKVAYFRYSGAE